MTAQVTARVTAQDGPSRSALVGAGLSSEVFLRTPGQVLKLYREGSDPAAIENEYRASRLAHARGIPTARPIALVQEDGRNGILFERLHGPTLLARYARNPPGLFLALRRLARIHSAIHACAAEGLPAQHARLRAEIGWSRAPASMKAAALAALDRLSAGGALCHGDIHPGNVLCAADGLAVIDWQKATRGSPAADVARSQIMIRHGRLPGRLGRHRAVPALLGPLSWWYERCYRAESGVRPEEIAAWRLPLLVAKLCAGSTDKDAEILETVDRLMRARPGTAQAA